MQQQPRNTCTDGFSAYRANYITIIHHNLHQDYGGGGGEWGKFIVIAAA